MVHNLKPWWKWELNTWRHRGMTPWVIGPLNFMSSLLLSHRGSIRFLESAKQKLLSGKAHVLQLTQHHQHLQTWYLIYRFHFHRIQGLTPYLLQSNNRYPVYLIKHEQSTISQIWWFLKNTFEDSVYQKIVTSKYTCRNIILVPYGPPLFLRILKLLWRMSSARHLVFLR